MAQYKPSQKVKPEAVLQSVRTHRLFPQAEACIKRRLPKLEGIEGVCSHTHTVGTTIILLSLSDWTVCVFVRALTRGQPWP